MRQLQLLRWHLFFDRPVDAFAGLDAVTLLDGTGARVPHALVELPEGLWDATRLTLLLHPGRIKSGLQMRERHGGALLASNRMSLRTDLERLLGPGAGEMLHGFDVGPALEGRIGLETWSISAVEAGRLDPLMIGFHRSMDRLGVEGAVAIVDPAGQAVAGRHAYAPMALQWPSIPRGHGGPVRTRCWWPKASKTWRAIVW